MPGIEHLRTQYQFVMINTIQSQRYNLGLSNIILVYKLI